VLAFESVTKRYARPSGETVALDAVTFEVVEHDFFTVVGSARSGKSTLLRLAAGVEFPDSGTVRILGRDTATLRRRERAHMLRHDVGCIFGPDDIALARETVDFVAWPLISSRVPYRECTARARKMLRRVGAEGYAGARLQELSASEQMRVCIAQACVREPRMLLADEPANTLDSIESDNILGLLRSLASEAAMTVLMTTGDATRMVGTTHMAALSRGRMRVEPRDSGELVRFRQPGGA
jgi:ABC-type ATPase involved in cell division